MKNYRIDEEGNGLIPDHITEIEYGAFEDCTDIRRIEIPYGVTRIGNQAFLGCVNLTD